MKNKALILHCNSCVVNVTYSISGPKPPTIHDMWRMIWELQTNRIVMVTGLVEKGKVRNIFLHLTLPTLQFGSSFDTEFKKIAFFLAQERREQNLEANPVPSLHCCKILPACTVPFYCSPGFSDQQNDKIWLIFSMPSLPKTSERHTKGQNVNALFGNRNDDWFLIVAMIHSQCYLFVEWAVHSLPCVV